MKLTEEIIDKLIKEELSKIKQTNKNEKLSKKTLDKLVNEVILNR